MHNRWTSFVGKVRYRSLAVGICGGTTLLGRGTIYNNGEATRGVSIWFNEIWIWSVSRNRIRPIKRRAMLASVIGNLIFVNGRAMMWGWRVFATLWARAKVADLRDQALHEGRDVSADIKATALLYGIISEFTNFIAVDSTQRTEGDHGTTAAVPAPVPEGALSLPPAVPSAVFSTTTHKPLLPS